MAARVGLRGGPVKPLEAVVRSFAGDHDVVRVRFAQARGRDLDELGLGPERLDVAHPAIPHAAAEAAHHLEDHVGGGTPVGHAALDALGHELRRRHLTLLEVAVGGAFLHGAEAAHPADHLEAPALEQERLARALLGAREHRPHHHALGPRRERLHHVARVLDAAVRNHRHVPRPPPPPPPPPPPWPRPPGPPPRRGPPPGGRTPPPPP